MNQSLDTCLDDILVQYSMLKRIDFGTLRSWEQLIQDPHDKARLYQKIVMDQLLSDADPETLEAGLLGYIKGQQMNVIDEIEHLATTDALTGLANRKGYSKGVERCLARYERENYSANGKSIAMLFIDINKFKEEANDKYDHKFGDDILRYVADALRQFTRGTDVRARLGGDEFIVVLDPFKMDNPEECLRELAEKMNRYIQRRIEDEHPDKEARVSVSIGMSIYQKDAVTREKLETHADQAMYYAKRNPISHNGLQLHFHIFDPAMQYSTKEDRKGRS